MKCRSSSSSSWKLLIIKAVVMIINEHCRKCRTPASEEVFEPVVALQRDAEPIVPDEKAATNSCDAHGCAEQQSTF